MLKLSFLSFRGSSIHKRLLISFACIGLVPFAILSGVSAYLASGSLSEQSYQQLDSIRAIKKQQILNFFNQSKQGVLSLASHVESYIHTDSLDSIIKMQASSGENVFSKYLDHYGYHDILLLNPDGFVDYSVAKGHDYQTSLTSGPYKNTNLARLYREVSASGKFGIVDFASYAPSNNAPAGFLAAPVFDREGQLAKIVVLHISLEPINNIMGVREGMGKAGESYLVGPDYLMRSDSFLDPENYSVKASFANPESGSAKTQPVLLALDGKTGSQITQDYRGEVVLSSFTPLDYDGLHWALLVEADKHEAFAALYQLEFWIMVIAVYGVMMILYTAWRIAQGIITPIQSLASTVRKVEQEGDFSVRFDVQEDNEIGQTGLAVNSLLDSLQGMIADTKYVVGNMAEGNFTGRIRGELKGDLKVLQDTVNRSADQAEKSIAALGSMMESLSLCQFDAESEVHADELRGDYQVMLNRLQNAMSSIGSAVTEINRVMSLMEVGEFSQPIEADLPGELNQLKEKFNRSLSIISGATEEIANVARLQAEGNLAVKISGDYAGRFDELKAAINHGQMSISALVSEVRISAEDVFLATSEISSGNDYLSQSIQQQAYATQRTQENTAEVGLQGRKTANDTRNVHKITTDLSSLANDGTMLMERANHSMDGIKESNKRIKDITSIIDSLAFQTNLLSLNAAVEAARAGEQGRGFAVVASEVRQLALRSADAAKSIKGLISESELRVADGSHQVGLSAQSLIEINQGIQKVQGVVNEISESTQTQADSLDMINNEIISVEQSSQQNAVQVEEISASANNMNRKAKNLDSMMSRFVLDD